MARKRRGGRHTDPDSPYYEVVDEVDEADDYDDSPRRRRRRRREREPRRRRSWVSRIFILLLLLAAVAAALPTIITQTPLRNTALNWGGQLVGLQLQAERVSGGWFAQPKAENVTIRDQQGQPLLEAASVQIDRNLLSLLRNQKDLGVIRLNKPVAHVSLRDDGNNWLDALKPMLEKESSGKTPKMQLVIEEGAVHIQDPRKLQALSIGPLKLEATIDEQQQTPITCKIATRLSDSVGQSGELNVTVDSNSMDFASGEARVSSERIPLATLQTMLASVAPHLQVTGNLDLQSMLKWNLGDQPRAHLQIDSMEVSQLRARSAQLPPGDEIRLSLLRGVGGVRWEDGNLLADNLQLESDVASVAATGRVKLSRLLAQTGIALGNDDEMDIAAQFDVARLAAMMPTTMRIREDTQIDSGLVQASINSKLEQGKRVWHGVLTTSKVAATTRGQQVQWEQPIAIEFDASQQAGNWVVRKLNCVSSFLQVQGSGQPNAGRVDINGDLNRLRTELSQFVNLGDIRLAGKAGGFVAWQPGPTGPQANGRLDLSQFQLELPGKAPLVEPQLALQFVAAAKRGPQGEIASIEEGQLTVNAGDDRMLVKLTSPVAYNTAQPTYPMQFKVSGDLSRWLMRVAVLTKQPKLKGEGAFSINGSVIASPTQVAISQSSLTAQNCRIEGLAVPIDEREVTADVIGTYDFPTQRWIGGKSTIKSATFAAGCNNLSIQPGSITGDIGLRGDLPRILRLLNLESADQRFQGEFSGTVRLSQQRGETHFSIQQRLEQFAVLNLGVQPLRTVSTSPTWQTAWAEPFIDLDTTGVFTPGNGALNFQSLKVGLDSAQLDVSGSLSDLQGRIIANLNGQLSYDLQRLTKKLKPVIGNSVVLEGVSKKPISIRGPLKSVLPSPAVPGQVATNAAKPLLPMDLVATAGFQWDAAAIEGFRIGPGQISTTLEQATVRFDGMQIPVSQGKLLLSPQISFRTASPVLTIPPGPVVENLSISQEMTHTWMKYLAPMLADATTIQGTFSADVEKVNIPLTNAKSGEVKGRLKIHGAQAGPGPLAQQLIAFIAQTENVVKNVGNGAGNINLDRALELLNNGGLVNPQGRLDPQRTIGGLLGGLGGNPTTSTAPNTNAVWLQVPEHQVGFHVAQGRVYHQGMRVIVDNIEVQTTGSVGLDESLDLVAQMAIPAKWIGNTPSLASLQGKTIQVPITGTIRNPKLDRRVVQSLLGQLVNGAATGAIGNVFGQGPAGQGGVPRMLPTNPNAPAPNGAAPSTAPNGTDPVNDLNNNIQNGINNATGNAQREVDRALRKLFGN